MIEVGEAEVLNRAGVIVPAEDWEAFAAWLNRPAEIIPALAELACRTSSWERPAEEVRPC